MSESLVQSGVARVRAIVSSLAQAALFVLSDADLLALLDAVHRALCQLEELLVRIVGEVDSRGIGRGDRAVRSTRQVLTQRLRLAPSQAGQLERLARALRDTELAPTAEAFAAGAISLAHARRIAEAMDKLPDEATPHTREVVQEHLIDHATRFDPDQTAGLGREALKRVDPELADRVLAEQLEREERQAARERTVWFRSDGHGSVRFGGRLDTASAAILRAALDPLTKPTPPAREGSRADHPTRTGTDNAADADTGTANTGTANTGETGGAGGAAERRTFGQRQADALVELARRVMQAGNLPKHGGEPTQLVLTMRHTDLIQGINAAYLPTGEAISAALARQLACDAHIIPVVLDSASVPMDVGRGKRCFDGKLRKGLDLRDGGCAFPGCDIPAAWCDGHHLTPWWQGGATSLDNGVLLCRHHHRTIHQEDWTVQLGSDRRPEFIPPPWVDPDQKPLRNPPRHLPYAA